MKTIPMIRFVTVILALACLFSAVMLAQQKKSYVFHGTVQSVDQKTAKMTVDGEAVPGWMGAMSMGYAVDNPAVLKIVKVGDRIEATVYDGDYVLHNVKVVPPQKK
jgi:Cu/Ag efflux protein CusF